MPIPELTKQNILDALQYIDENGGVPHHNQSLSYDLITENGKKYPPIYVIAVAAHLVYGTEISTSSITANEARSALQKLGFTIEKRQEKYFLTITADAITSTDERFTMDNIALGDNYAPIDAYFEKPDGAVVKRAFRKGEKKRTNMTLPRLACQIFEDQLVGLSAEQKEDFPICQYTPTSDIIRGIFSNVEDFKARISRSYCYLFYHYGEDRIFVIYSWNIFSTLLFVQECLKRFGEAGDKFVLTYRDKDEKDKQEEVKEADEEAAKAELVQEFKGYGNPYSSILIESKNLIFRGAPGTGKTYLAKQIAADIISNGYYDNYDQLTDEQKKQVEFVQFHPSYDYTNFVEGLRPISNMDGSMGFELQDGIFKQFVARARKNYEDSQKSEADIEKEYSVQEAMDDFFSSVLLKLNLA